MCCQIWLLKQQKKKLNIACFILVSVARKLSASTGYKLSFPTLKACGLTFT